MNDKYLNKKFSEFLQSCSSDELYFIAKNEISEDEIIKVLLEKNDDVKENILENFVIRT